MKHNDNDHILDLLFETFVFCALCVIVVTVIDVFF